MRLLKRLKRFAFLCNCQLSPNDFFFSSTVFIDVLMLYSDDGLFYDSLPP